MTERGMDGALESAIYFLEATLLRAELLAASFADFAESELLAVAAAPYDAMTIGALDRYGPIGTAEMWALSPSIALGGPESLDNVVSLRSDTAMTFAGDIATALRASLPGSWPTAVEPWMDEEGRRRLKVSFVG